MFRFGARPRSAHRRRGSLRLLGETLEARALLALDFASLAIDPGDFDPGSVLVRFQDDAPPGLAWAAQGKPVTPWTPGLRRVTLPHDLAVEAALEALRAHPQVLYAEPNYRVHAAQVPNDPALRRAVGIGELRANRGDE
jgi:hypothetical protein